MSSHKTTVLAQPGTHELVITREFDAPRDLVFKVMTDPKLMPQWWGPRRLTTEVDRMDVRSGGEYRFINRDAEGNSYGFHGVYHEILAPERIIDTFEFEGLPEAGHVALETMRLEALPGDRTRITVQAVYQTVIDRDMTLESGMEEGLDDTYDRLQELLDTLKNK